MTKAQDDAIEKFLDGYFGNKTEMEKQEAIAVFASRMYSIGRDDAINEMKERLK